MIASKATPSVEEEGAEVDGAEGVGGAADPDHLERNYASLCLMVAASMAHITWKWSDIGKGTEKWSKILMIAEGKMSLLRVAEYIYDRKNEMKGKIYSKMPQKRKQKSSTRLINRVIVRKIMQNKGHNHVKKPRAFSKGRTRSELTITPIRGTLIKTRYKLVFRYSLKTLITKVVRMRYPRDMAHQIQYPE